MPRWDGLWVTAGNTHMDMFIDPPGFTGKVRAGVLTPPYEAAYKERWRQQQELGEVQYDRLTHCEPPGYPRWLLEPYSHEFVNLPHQSYMINDYGPGIRRVYIGQEHKNVYGTHSWYGDTIGFWDGNKLVTHTKYLLPADFTRWSPMTSNQFESVETWELKQYPGGIERLEVQVTFYDKHAFVKPVSAVYAFRRAKELEAAGHRVQHWECEGSSNDFLRQRHDDVEAAGRGRVQGSAGHDALSESAGPVSRSDLQHHAAERERSRKMKTRFRVLLVALIALLLTAAAASAHHSFAMFDRSVEKVATGTVVRWTFNNPHSWLYLNVKDKDGNETLWSFEGSAPPALLQRGITGSTFEPGNTVTISIVR